MTGVFFSAKVVSVQDDDFEGKIEVFCPKLMSKQRPDTDTDKDITVSNSAKNCLENNYETLTDGKSVKTKETKTAYPFLMNGSSSHGTMVIPEVGDLVLVTMLDNDPSQMYYIGSPYKVGTKMSDIGTIIEDSSNFSDPKNYTKMKVLIKTVGGNFIAVNDNNNAHSILIKSSNGSSTHRLKFSNSPSDKSVEFTTGNNHIFRLDDTNKKITLQSTNGNKLVIDDNTNDVSMYSQGTMHLKSTGVMRLTGSQIYLN